MIAVELAWLCKLTNCLPYKIVAHDIPQLFFGSSGWPLQAKPLLGTTSTSRMAAIMWTVRILCTHDVLSLTTTILAIYNGMCQETQAIEAFSFLNFIMSRPSLFFFFFGSF